MAEKQDWLWLRLQLSMSDLHLDFWRTRKGVRPYVSGSLTARRLLVVGCWLERWAYVLNITFIDVLSYSRCSFLTAGQFGRTQILLRGHYKKQKQLPVGTLSCLSCCLVQTRKECENGPRAAVYGTEKEDGRCQIELHQMEKSVVSVLREAVAREKKTGGKAGREGINGLMLSARPRYGRRDRIGLEGREREKKAKGQAFAGLCFPTSWRFGSFLPLLQQKTRGIFGRRFLGGRNILASCRDLHFL